MPVVHQDAENCLTLCSHLFSSSLPYVKMQPPSISNRLTPRVNISMKIRSHLLLLVLGAVVPVLAFSTVMTVVSWREQRHALEQRYLGRARAMAMALNRDLDGTIRSLQVLAASARGIPCSTGGRPAWIL